MFTTSLGGFRDDATAKARFREGGGTSNLLKLFLCLQHVYEILMSYLPLLF